MHCERENCLYHGILKGNACTCCKNCYEFVHSTLKYHVQHIQTHTHTQRAARSRAIRIYIRTYIRSPDKNTTHSSRLTARKYSIFPLSRVARTACR